MIKPAQNPMNVLWAAALGGRVIEDVGFMNAGGNARTSSDTITDVVARGLRGS